MYQQQSKMPASPAPGGGVKRQKCRTGAGILSVPLREPHSGIIVQHSDKISSMTSSALEKTALAGIRCQFVADSSRPNIQLPCLDLLEGRIEGCHAYRLQPGSDDRGDLFELLTTRNGAIEPIVHVYQVWAEPGSIRAWCIMPAKPTDCVLLEDRSR